MTVGMTAWNLKTVRNFDHLQEGEMTQHGQEALKIKNQQPLQ